jgi:hypothetical protein
MEKLKMQLTMVIGWHWWQKKCPIPLVHGAKKVVTPEDPPTRRAEGAELIEDGPAPAKRLSYKATEARLGYDLGHPFLCRIFGEKDLILYCTRSSCIDYPLRHPIHFQMTLVKLFIFLRW